MTDIGISKYDHYVDVILPLALPQTYTYRVSIEHKDYVKIGSRVIVPFQGNRLYTGIISNIHHKAPENYQAKYLLNVLDDEAVVSAKNIELWKWIAKYYNCTLGEVMNAALPSAMKLTSETRIIINHELAFDKNDLNDKEFLHYPSCLIGSKSIWMPILNISYTLCH